MVEQPAPHRHTTGGGDQVGGPGFGAFERRDEGAEQVLEHEAPGTGTGVDRGQDEQRFEQDREVVPERHGVFTRQDAVQDLRNTDRQGRRTTGTGQDGGFTNVMRHGLQRFRRDREAPAGNHLRNRSDVTADHSSRAVHSEVHARLDHRRGNHGHDRHERLHQHTAVADVASVGFVIQQLRRGARRDQCVEARYRTASDGDEQEREQTALPHRASAIDELGQRRHFQLGHGHQNTDRQGDDGADFQERRQVVARCQNQPNRQRCSDETVTDQHPGNLHAGEGERLGPHRISSNLPTEPDRPEQQQHADHGDFADAARADVAHVNAHEHRDRDGRHHRENAPRAFGQGFHHDQRQHREDDDHDQEAAEQGNGAGHAAHFFTHHVAQGTAVAPGRHEQHHEVLHRARQHHAGNQPERAGQVAHLRGQHRADQRSGARDRGEVVTEKNVFVGRHIVQTIIVEHGGGGPTRVQLHHVVGDEQTVVTVRNQINGHSGDHDPQGVDRLAAAQRHYAQGARSYDCQH
ncbi:hypothetical protein D3C86_251650 [compost metagenome]